MPTASHVQEALSAWRRAERDLEGVDPESDEAARLMTEVECRRVAYHAIANGEGRAGQAEVDDAEARANR